MAPTLTDDHLAGLGGLHHLVGTAHLRVADSPDDEDDESGAAPPFVLSVGLMLLTGTVSMTTSLRILLMTSKNMRSGASTHRLLPKATNVTNSCHEDAT